MNNNQSTNRSKKLVTTASIAGVVIAGALAVGTTLGLPSAGAQASEGVPASTAVMTEATSPVVEAFAVEDAGIVTLQSEGDSLVLISVEPAEGWTYDAEVEDGEVEVEFTDPNGAELEFAAELRDGQLEVYIEAEGEAPGGYEGEEEHGEYETDEYDEDTDEEEEDENHG